MSFNPVVNGLRLGSLVQIYGNPKTLDDREIDGKMGQLVKYTPDVGKFTVQTFADGSVELETQHVRAPLNFKTPGQVGGEEGFDVIIGPATATVALQEEIAACIFEKGFCVLRVCQDAADVAIAVETVRQLGKEGKLTRLPREVEEGYLGDDAKAKVMWLDPDDPELPTNHIIEANDQNMSFLASLLQPYSMDIFGKQIEERSPSLLSLSLCDEEEEEFPYPEADDKTLGDFLGVWRRGLIRAVHFFGPESATITLDAKPGDRHRIVAQSVPCVHETLSFSAPPNTIVLYRTECYEHAMSASGELLALTSCFLSPQPQITITSWEGDWSAAGEGPPPPQGNVINVLNLATRLGKRWDEAEMFEAGTIAGTDAVVEIPITRFNVDFYYCPDPEQLMNGPPRTTQRHMSFIDGMDIFDNKYFEISNNDAAGMGPLQRMVLEVGGNCLFMHGISKKAANRESHHAGCSVGLDKDDYVTLPTANGSGMNALAIIANRFSFIFNMKGPNYVCDTACSASLTATHLAKHCLLDRTWDPLEFHVAIGTHMCLSPGPFIGCSMSQMTSPSGRCFTFNATANGYLRGEGSSGMLLKHGSQDMDKLAVYRASQVGQDGRSASLTAPNGPAQEEMISRAVREARMTPPESTEWECHGTGTSLGDPIEVGAVRKIQIKMDRPEPLMLSTSKSNQGHLEGGAAMAGMVKCVLELKQAICMPTLHVHQLNPHLEHAAFTAFFSTETSMFKYQQGHAQVSSLGFGGSNGHAVFWGKNAHQTINVEAQIVKRLAQMSPPEVRPIGDGPDDWEAEIPEPDAGPDDVYTIGMSPDDPPNAAMKWVKVEPADSGDHADDDDDAFYSITGNFNSWADDRMESGDFPGVHSVTVEIPPSGTLEFRFLKEGDSDKALAPAVPKCAKRSCHIVGPENGLTNTWMIIGTAGCEVQIDLVVRKSIRAITWIFK